MPNDTVPAAGEAMPAANEANTTLHDTMRDEAEFDKYEASLPRHLKRENRPRLEIGYRLTVMDCDRIALTVIEDLFETIKRRQDKAGGETVATDQMEPPSVQELIARAGRQIHECEAAKKRLDATTKLLLEFLATWSDDEEEEATNG